MKKKWLIKFSPNTFGSIFEGFGAKASWKFWRDWKYFDTLGESIKFINESIPKGGMGSQICCAFLYKRTDRKYVLYEKYRRKSEYKDDGAYPTDKLESWHDDGSAKALKKPVGIV